MIDVKLLLNSPFLEKYSAGTLISSEKDRKIDRMFIVMSGKVGQIVGFTTPNEKCVQVIDKGGMFGEEGLFCAKARSTVYLALEDVTAAVIVRSDLNDIIKKNSELAIQISQTICASRLKSDSVIKQLNREKEKLFEICPISEDAFYKSMLFPKGHGQYIKERPPEYEQFLFKRAYVCPNCQTQFNDFMLLSTRLVPAGALMCNMRRKYKDFEPLWYDVMTCPHCYFSALEASFNSKTRLRKEMYETALNTVHDRVNFSFEETKTLENVFASYCLALICADGYDNKEQLKAKLWLYMSWLYADENDEKMEVMAADNAYEQMLDYIDTSFMASESQQVNFMILGTLARKIGKMEDAITYLKKAVRVSPGKPVYKQLAEREIEEIREIRESAFK